MWLVRNSGGQNIPCAARAYEKWALQVLLCLEIEVIALLLDDLVNLVKDLSVPLIHHDPSDRGSLILIRNISKERINLYPNHSRTVVSSKPELSRRDFLKLWPFYEHRKSIPPVKFHYFFSVLRSLGLELLPCFPLSPHNVYCPHGEALNPLQGLQYFLYDYDQSLVELAAPFPVIYALLASTSLTQPALVRYEIKLCLNLNHGLFDMKNDFSLVSKIQCMKR